MYPPPQPFLPTDNDYPLPNNTYSDEPYETDDIDYEGDDAGSWNHRKHRSHHHDDNPAVGFFFLLIFIGSMVCCFIGVRKCMRNRHFGLDRIRLP